MIDDDRLRFAQMLRDVYVFYGKAGEFSDTTVEIWWVCMKPFDIDAVVESFGRHAVNPDAGRFLPKPADIVRMIGGSTLDSAMIALHKFEEALQRIGTYMTVVFDDPLIHVVVDELGGWVSLGLIKSKDWEFRRVEFMNRYRAYRARGEVPQFVPKLIGISDGENSSRGYVVDDTNLRLVGNPEKCRKVLAKGTDSPRLTISSGAALVEKVTTHLEDKRAS